ncbi:hypothetical protein ACFXKC_40160 [Streptomyces sp. NPDC059340]|uniref:hypothetical protein n=1 Tax=Streptomyces sp. NPDC059340 TaxID=3346806 RepID=UPI00369F32F2
MTAPQTDGVPAQFDALDRGTDLVTVIIGRHHRRSLRSEVTGPARSGADRAFRVVPPVR